MKRKGPRVIQALGNADNYQAEADLHHLIQAAKIRGDKKRHGAAMKKHKELKTALNAVPQQPLPQQPPPDQGQPMQGPGPMGDMPQ